MVGLRVIIQRDMMDIVHIITIIVVILLSMTLHEAMHAFMGYWLGDDTAKSEGRLTLNPIKHIDPFLTILLPVLLFLMNGPIFGGAKPVPFNPQRVRYGEWGAALVALAGPLTNLLIAFIAYGVLALTGIATGSQIGFFLIVMVQVNLGFFIFNMLPIPPLDGSRVLYAFAPEFVRRGMEFIEQYGLIFVMLLVLVSSYSNAGFITAIMQNGIDGILQLFQAIFGR